MEEETSATAAAQDASELIAEDMELETAQKEDAVGAETNGADSAENGESKSLKRANEDEGEKDENEAKKPKAEKSVEEERLEELDGEERKEGGDGGNVASEVKLGPKTFVSSVEMFDYFFKILHFWPPNLNLNKYEQMGLLDLLKKGHTEADRKIGVGIKSFQVRYHPMWKSRCFFLIREDESSDDFSFRKCVDHILPLPENMKGRPEVNKALGGRGGGGFCGRGRGRRGGKQRH
uniref:Uncharacterized protein n=1 Tax=Kalanchoe fedtschenkoi TaxID=63787 RepID=A0A7N0TXF4_KALFE